MPIYQCSVIVHNIICGGIVMNEFSFYNWKQLSLIATGTLICSSGILVIMEKYKLMTEKGVSSEKDFSKNLLKKELLLDSDAKNRQSLLKTHSQYDQKFHPLFFSNK